MKIVCDIGGTNMRVASFEETIFSISVEKTPNNYNDFISKLEEMIESVPDYRNSEKIVIGIAGLIDKSRGVVLRSPNLSFIEAQLFKTDLQKVFDKEIIIENDAALAGLAEANTGAGKNSPIVAYLTVGTGVGGARIDHGQIDSRTFGFEPGHHIIDFDSSAKSGATTANERGQLESFIGGRSCEKIYGKKPKDIEAYKSWNELAERLAVGIYNTILFWSPDIVVLGGSMILGNPAIPLHLVEEKVNKMLPHPLMKVPIKKAEMGDRAGLWGASLL